MDYIDDKGNRLYGYSQKDLGRLLGILRAFLWLGFAFFILVVFGLWYLIDNNVINNIVGHCVK